MAITKEQAIQIASENKAETMKNRFKVVDHIDGCPYLPKQIDIEKCWIVYVQRDEPNCLMLDGPQTYILVDKETGETYTTTSRGG
jgi:hypothetical protein